MSHLCKHHWPISNSGLKGTCKINKGLDAGWKISGGGPGICPYVWYAKDCPHWEEPNHEGT